MMVADIYTAISEDRPYRSGMSKDQIFEVFKKEVNSGSLDKLMVELLFDNYTLINEHVKTVQAAAYDFYETRLIGFR
jgi:HD-GYP domain-containing protein (c-di-GMP phosphodiesterase class II)